MVKASPCHKKTQTENPKAKQKPLIVEKQTRKEDQVSWEIVTIYLREEMKKYEVNSGWSILGRTAVTRTVQSVLYMR